MGNIEIDVSFVPEKLKAFTKNEVQMNIAVKNSGTEIYWSECDVVLSSPLSLSHDSELNSGRTRIGILKPGQALNRQVKLYTRPNNYPDDYKFSIIAYLYDGDGAVAERLEKKLSIPCAAEEKPMQDK